MTEVIFVSDLYKNYYAGGAELTTEAIIEKSPFPVVKVLSNKLTKAFINENKDKYWVFGNFSRVAQPVLLHAAKTLNYSVIEYDYKFCKYRLPQAHGSTEECDCENTTNGKTVAIFLSQAEAIWWMSEAQKEEYHKRFPFLQKNTNHVLSSVFTEKTLDRFEKYEPADRNDKWIILGSNSWVKGFKQNVAYAKENNLEYEVVQGLPHDVLLDKLASSKGLIFLPNGWDTCPRIVIEAKLLGCELVLNDHVQHKDEDWFQSRESILAHLKNNKSIFWEEVLSFLSSKAISRLRENDTTWSFAVPSYNEGPRLRRFLNSCSNMRKFGLDDVFIINHRSDDDTEDILTEFKPLLEERGINLNWEYEGRDFSKDFTMADLRMNTVKGCKNEIVHITDADNVIGKNFIFLVDSAIKSFEDKNIYAVGYERLTVDNFIKFNKQGQIEEHGPVLPHVSIPLWLRRDNVYCEQNHCGGRYYWFYPKEMQEPRWVTIPFGKGASTILAINDKDEERKKLRKTMNDFFVASSEGVESGNWLEAYNSGSLEEANVSKKDFYHESHRVEVDLRGQEFFKELSYGLSTY